MSKKYIDAEKLIHDLEERIDAYSKVHCAGDPARKDAIETLLKDVKHQCSLQQEQPSLSSNLDEAAEKIADKVMPQYPDISWDDCREKVIEGIKAGAEWMVEQGETVEGYIVDEISYAGVAVVLDNEGQFKPGEKVIVQIRKK